MGCATSSMVPPAMDADAAASKDLEKQLLRARLEDLFNFKILLLGAGESGKSTIVKQLRSIHNTKKPSKQELMTIGDSLHMNVIDCMKALLYACKKFGYELDDEADQKTAEQIQNFDEGSRISMDFGEDITRLYNSKAVKAAYKRRAEFWLLDSCAYYLKNIDRFTEEGFLPTEEDQVMARIRTTGIVVSQLEQKIANPAEDEPDTIKYQVVDVGGQRNERKKWIHCFDDVKAILFVVNLNAYNQVLFEDANKNRMIESVELFKEITHKEIFADTPIFLFLNKKDLFETMIMDVDLSVTFPEYTGGKNLLAALKFIEDMFMVQLPPKKRVGIHTVTGVWKRDVRCAFDDVKKDLLDHNRKAIEVEKAKIKKEERRVTSPKTGGGRGMRQSMQAWWGCGRP